MARSKPHQFNVKSVAIIGAGPSGIAAAKYLVAEHAFTKIDIFEQRARVGGVWDYQNENKTTPIDFRLPQLSPHAGLAKPVWQDSGTVKVLGDDVEKKARFLSPLYDRLETNIPRGLMGFSDLDWPEDSQLFPKHETVTKYIEDYAEDVKHLINFDTQVVDVRVAECGDSGRERWSVKTKAVHAVNSEQPAEGVYDAVVVASGHFSVPFIPDIKGLKAWSERYPGIISHSMYYKKPEEYTDKKVIIVGNGASGSDIAFQIMTTCRHPLLQSSRSESQFLSGPSPEKVDVPEITEFLLDNDQERAVRLADGRIEKDIDAVLFATGYFYSFPFLDTLDPPLIDDGTHVNNLYQHLIYRARPTIAFPVLQQRVIPFPMSEVQAAILARLWSGRLTLPSTEEMITWEEDTLRETGGGRDFHFLKFPKDANYINMMHDWAMSAVDGESKGKKPPRWGEKEYWLRERFPQIKKAFQEKGEKRHQVRSVEELGFNFEEYKRDRAAEQKSLL